eukprot:scaffold9689_cov116-Isochrysis_galbana.AAC.6
MSVKKTVEISPRANARGAAAPLHGTPETPTPLHVTAPPPILSRRAALRPGPLQGCIRCQEWASLC